MIPFRLFSANIAELQNMSLHKISAGTVKKRKRRVTQDAILFILQCISGVQHYPERHKALGDVVVLEF